MISETPASSAPFTISSLPSSTARPTPRRMGGPSAARGSRPVATVVMSSLLSDGGYS